MRNSRNSPVLRRSDPATYPARLAAGYARIWETVCRIPRGRVSTYGRIALLGGRPGQARFSGYALHNLPPGTDVPWHRVVNARGEIAFPRGSRSWREQRRLLEREGVRFENDRIDLTTRGWPQPWR